MTCENAHHQGVIAVRLKQGHYQIHSPLVLLSRGDFSRIPFEKEKDEGLTILQET